MPDPSPSGLATWLQAGSVIIAAWAAVYSFGAWRRQLIGSKKAEVAEKLLVSCYEARDIIEAARNPFVLENEGKARSPIMGETEAQTRPFDRYWATAERLIKRSDFFATFAATQYTAKAYLGDGVTDPIMVIIEKRTQIIDAAGMLIKINTPDPLIQQDQIPIIREKCRQVIWSTGEKSDEIKTEIDAAVRQVEAICRPILEHVPGIYSSLDWIRGQLAAVWQYLRR
jgi:hypothetical protein